MAKIKGKDSIKAKYKSLSKAGKTRRLSPDEKKEKRRLGGLLRGKPFGKVLLQSKPYTTAFEVRWETPYQH